MKQYIMGLTTTFGIIAAIILVTTTLSFGERPAVIINDPGDALVEIRKQVDAKQGMPIPKHGSIYTRELFASFSLGDTVVEMEPSTSIRIKTISDDLLELYSSTGKANITANRTVNYCTRATCAVTTGYFYVNYITPGEIVEYYPTADMVIKFNNELWPIGQNETIRINELTNEVETTPIPHPLPIR
jgi:hypothetical protein